MNVGSVTVFPAELRAKWWNFRYEMEKSVLETRNRKQRRLKEHGRERPESRERLSARRPSQAGGSSERLSRILPWLAVLAAVAIFAGTVSYPFVYDDVEQIGLWRRRQLLQ